MLIQCTNTLYLNKRKIWTPPLPLPYIQSKITSPLNFLKQTSDDSCMIAHAFTDHNSGAHKHSVTAQHQPLLARSSLGMPPTPAMQVSPPTSQVDANKKPCCAQLTCHASKP